MTWHKKMMRWTSLAVFIGFIGSFAIAHAANATLSVSAEIVNAVNVTQNTPLSFGRFTLAGAGAVSIAAETDGSNSSTGGVSLVNSAQRGLVTITASSGAKMLVTVGNATLTNSGSSDTTLTMSSAECALDNGGAATVGSCSFTMPESGIALVGIGGTLNAGGDESIGLYSGTITVIANFN